MTFKKLYIKLEWKASIWYHEMKFFYIFKIDQQITELWHFEILQRVCVAQVFLLILDENLKFKKLYLKLEWKASIWYHEMKIFNIFKIDQQITELWHFEILQRVCVAQVFLLILDENSKFKK